jgi:exonuclease III
MTISENNTLKELLFWSYSNLAMAHTAIDRNQKVYEPFNKMIRTRLFKGLNNGSMNIRSIFDDEKLKLQTGQICNYCGSKENLALDHIFPQKKGGKDDAENLIFACKSCNSSKGKKDLMKWMIDRGEFLPIMVIRRYLKLVFSYSIENNLLDKRINELNKFELPFELNYLPFDFPKPINLKLNINDRNKYRIANWNLERPKSGTKKTKLALKKINELDSDIIVLTETSEAVNLSKNYLFSISTKPFDRTPKEQWVTIWSKYEITKKLETFDSYRTVSCNIKMPFGEISIYGNIIPYHMAGVKGIRYGELGYKSWEYHEKDIYAQSENWRKIIKQEKLPLFIIGDFNQTRFENKGYGTKKVRDILTTELNKNKTECITEVDFSLEFLMPDPKTEKIRKNIDHICVSNSLLSDVNNLIVGAWNNFDSENNYMSDHNGVYVDFEM